MADFREGVLGKILLIAAAGGLGALARYGLSGLAARWHGGSFPWGTMAVNVAGCFVFGLLWSLAEGRLAIGGETRAIVFIGFLGAFTTFSSFAYETAALLRDAQWLLAGANVAGQNAAGLAFVLLGLGLGRLL